MRIRSIVCLQMVLWVLTGCAMTAIQRQQVAAFGKATEAVGSFAAAQFPELRNQAIQMKKAKLILNTEDWDPKTPMDLDKPLRAEGIAQRVAAAKALQSYGTLLNELATADQKTNISKAAQGLIDNFDSASRQGYLQTKRAQL